MKKNNIQFWIISIVLSICLSSVNGQEYPFQNPDLSIDERVNDLVSRMTLEEKISQMQNGADAIPRLGIPEYDWWNECLYSVARNGIATVFPQAIGMAATWNPELIGEEAEKSAMIVEAVEIVQLYDRDMESSVKQPVKSLKGFKRTFIKSGGRKIVEIPLAIYQC